MRVNVAVISEANSPMYVLKYLETDVSKILTGAFVWKWSWFRNLEADAGPEPNIKSEFLKPSCKTHFHCPQTHQCPSGEAVARGSGVRWHICGRFAL